MGFIKKQGQDGRVRTGQEAAYESSVLTTGLSRREISTSTRSARPLHQDPVSPRGLISRCSQNEDTDSHLEGHEEPGLCGSVG